MKKQFTSKILLALGALGCCAAMSAQTVIKVGAGQGAKQTTIQMAYDSLVVAPLTGAYVIELQSDYEPTTEVYPIKLKAKTGASATNSIIITPAVGVKKVIGPANKTVVFGGLTFAAGATTLTLPSVDGIKVGYAVYGAGLPPYVGSAAPYAYSTVSAVDSVTNTITMSNAATGSSVADKKTFIGAILTQAILFDGAKFVTIDGVSRMGDTGLTIQNPNSINCQTLMFTNSADNCTVKNCYVRGANVSGTYNNGIQGTVYMKNATNITITKCDVCDMNDPNIPFPITAFQITGEGTNSFIEVSESNVYNVSNYNSTNGNSAVFQFGSAGGQGNKILNNRIFWTKETFVAGFNLMGVGGSMNGLGNRFEGNIIGYDSPEGTGVSILKSTTGSTLKAIGNLRNFTCKNNTISSIEFTGVNFTAIELGGSVAQTIDPDVVCNNNIVENIKLNLTANGTLNGILINIASPYNSNIKNNIVRNLSVESATAAQNAVVAGINFTGTGNAQYKYTYSGNKVYDLVSGNVSSTGSNVAYGIRVGLNASAVERNLVYNVATSNADAKGIVRGIQTAGSNVNGLLIANNIVRIGTTVQSDAVISALYQEAATTAGDLCKIYNNTLYVGGSAPTAATKSTYGYFRNTGNSQLIDFQNNIVANKRAVAAQESHYAMNINAKTEFSKCDYNMYQYGANMGYVTTLVAAALDLAIWQNPDGLGLDTNSSVADPQFENATAFVPDMRLKATSPAKAAGTDLLSVVGKDFNDFARTTFDIGALAFGSITGISAVKDENISVYSANKSIVVNNMDGKNAQLYSLSGQLLKTVQLSSDKTSISVEKGLYFVKIGGKTAKVLVK